MAFVPLLVGPLQRPTMNFTGLLAEAPVPLISFPGYRTLCIAGIIKLAFDSCLDALTRGL